MALTLAGLAFLSTPVPGQLIVDGPAEVAGHGDFDGDGKDDVVVQFDLLGLRHWQVWGAEARHAGPLLETTTPT